MNSTHTHTHTQNSCWVQVLHGPEEKEKPVMSKIVNHRWKLISYLLPASWKEARKWNKVCEQHMGPLSRWIVRSITKGLDFFSSKNNILQLPTFYSFTSFSVALRPNAGHGLLILEVSRSHTTTPTVGRTPLDEWSARRRDLYLTTHNIHNRQTSMPPVGFEPTISAGQRSLGPAIPSQYASYMHIIQVDQHFSNYRSLSSGRSPRRLHFYSLKKVTIM